MVMPRVLWALLPTALIVASLGVRASAAPLVNENLIAAPPPGFKVGLRQTQNDVDITEWIPAGQTIKSWTEMLTVQTFHALKVAPDRFMDDVERRWRAACPGAGFAQPLAKGAENGYPALIWILDCPRNPLSGQPEITWFKAMLGNDNFYVVQKAFKFTPSKEQIDRWVGYLKSVTICDSRLPDRACPRTEVH